MEIQKKLNRRPRGKLDFDTPKTDSSNTLPNFALAVRLGRKYCCLILFLFQRLVLAPMILDSNKKSRCESGFICCRGTRIRTWDLLLPKQAP